MAVFATEVPGFVIRALVLAACGPRAYARLAAARSVFSRGTGRHHAARLHLDQDLPHRHLPRRSNRMRP
jgi:hypothetical protein